MGDFLHYVSTPIKSLTPFFICDATAVDPDVQDFETVSAAELMSDTTYVPVSDKADESDVLPLDHAFFTSSRLTDFAADCASTVLIALLPTDDAFVAGAAEDAELAIVTSPVCNTA